MLVLVFIRVAVATRWSSLWSPRKSQGLTPELTAAARAITPSLDPLLLTEKKKVQDSDLQICGYYSIAKFIVEPLFCHGAIVHLAQSFFPLLTPPLEQLLLMEEEKSKYLHGVCDSHVSCQLISVILNIL